MPKPAKKKLVRGKDFVYATKRKSDGKIVCVFGPENKKAECLQLTCDHEFLIRVTTPREIVEVKS